MKQIIKFIIILLSASMLCACTPSNSKLNLEDIKAVCELATVKCYYNNVAKIEKEKNSIFQKDREMWLEYEGVAVIGVDISLVTMNIVGNKIEMSMPPAELLEIKPVTETLNDQSYTISNDGLFFKNKITTEDQQQAVMKGQEEMEKSVLENRALFERTEKRAKALVSNYIIELSKISGYDYEIIWAN